MTKRRIDRDLDELSEAVLVDLAPTKRLQLLLESYAAEKKEWATKLRETCPRETYRSNDLAYVRRGQLAARFAQAAVYELHTTALYYKNTYLHQLYNWVIDLYRDEEPSEETLEEANDRVEQLRALFVALYTQYYAWQRFADEVLGVELATWFELHYEGAAVLDIVRSIIEDDTRIDLTAKWVADEVANTNPKDNASDTQLTLDLLVDVRYNAHVDVWSDAVDRLT